MVLKSALAAAVCTGFLALAGSATAAEYRPGELLSLDLPSAVFSPKRIGPEARFGPVRIEARSEDTEADLDSTIWPKLPPRKAHAAKSQAEKSGTEAPRAAARAKLAKPRHNPLDAQARDTRIQTWPCRSGGICNWQR
ncbi:hypothetical protein [Bradyrhizobium sp. AUGA SZCCT0160]|uniref:hypothetical protein n=1 Tax=Bradyrhizobium sp. AUGA SZCCT0160 TaxID=2807662 RepID=UPI001BAD9F03|nr:hypothetical protein [Bradyrhizobium sp. AUGA SZCCT0160]MBR1190885.1 hypothetical protein [Bradyrhizobium sp. AUGA SZCCT0160]